MKKTITLNGAWDLYYQDGVSGDRLTLQKRDAAKKIEGRVPGNADLDLSRAGILPEDLYKGMNTVEAYRTETWDYLYERSFDFAGCGEDETCELVFAGVDCLAEYFLNGEKIGESQNAFIPHRFPVSPRIGKNVLSVLIRSAVLAQNEKPYPAYLFAGWHVDRGLWLRKPAHSFGWDIFPRAATAGLWRDVALEISDRYGFEGHGYYYNFDNMERPSVKTWFSFRAPYGEIAAGRLTVRVEGKCGDSVFGGEVKTDPGRSKAGFVNAAVSAPKLWWPKGYGEANLYDVTLTLLRDGEVVDEIREKIGLRKLELQRTDSLGENSCFRFVVNNVPVMAKGSNWVPLNPYHSLDAGRYEKAFELVNDVGCNILRVWGGGVYEADEFYRRCDESGVMVWQDFMMACQIVPMEEDFLKELRKEFTTVVRALRHHPSIVLWSGDNEIDEAMASNGFNPENNVITRKLLPEIVTREDYQRPYLPSSPYLPGSVWEGYRKGRDVFVERHLWGARDYYKADFYKNSKAHFVSETGYHGCPARSSLEKMVTKEALWPIFNEEWCLHSSDQYGNMGRVELMMNQVKQLFGFEPDNLDDFILASQISQAEAKKFFIERIRAKKPYTGGVIWWNLLDGWPQMSDAVVDYYYEKKLAYRYIKRAEAPFTLLMDEMHDWHYDLIAANDSMETRRGSFRAEDIETGEVFAEGRYDVGPNENKVIAGIRLMYSDQRMLLLTWKEDGGEEGFNHYLCGMPGFDFESYRRWLGKLEERE
ncbi:MAG: hypothetical protein IJM21_09090 [Clostridia bacterium]|nr:hypothetical protein [Clostridia bacterium]